MRSPAWGHGRPRNGAITGAGAITSARAITAARVLAGLVLSAFVGCGGCGKKKDDNAIPPPPPRGAASSDELSTPIGQARGLPEELAPTSAKWKRIFAIDDKRVVLAGEVGTEAIALLTDDAGKTWKSLRTEKDTWSSWAAGSDGSIVLALGSRDGAAAANGATVEATRLLFASFESPTLTAPAPLFPTLKGPVKGLVQTDSAIPALFAGDQAALIAEETPRKPVVFYGGKPGSTAVAPLRLPGEKIVPVPFGRPPMLLSVRGRDLVARPVPVPGKPLEAPKKIAGVASTATLVAELSTAPACEAGELSFQRVKQGKKLNIVGVSAAKQVSFALPDATIASTPVGCGHGKVIVESVDEKTKGPNLLVCDLAGKCLTPTNTPFRIWPEQHERQVTAVPTDQGVLAVLSARAGERWGLYLAQAPEATVYERPRVIGEGSGDRGRVELGAFVGLGKRVLLLISADVTGTSHRGWFVMVSDDGGTNWNPP